MEFLISIDLGKVWPPLLSGIVCSKLRCKCSEHTALENLSFKAILGGTAASDCEGWRTFISPNTCPRLTAQIDSPLVVEKYTSPPKLEGICVFSTSTCLAKLVSSTSEVPSKTERGMSDVRHDQRAKSMTKQATPSAHGTSMVSNGFAIAHYSGPAICHCALVMAECQRGVRNPLIWIDLWLAALIQIDLWMRGLLG